MKFTIKKIVTLLVIFTTLGTSGWLLSLQSEKESKFTQHFSLNNQKTYISQKVSRQEMISFKSRLLKLEEQQQLILQKITVIHTRLVDLNAVIDQDTDNVIEVILEQPEEQNTEDTINDYKVNFSQESDDPEWSNQTEERIYTLIESDSSKGSNFLSVHCQTTLCRLEVSHNNDEARTRFMENLPMEPPFDTETFFHALDDGNGYPGTVIYLARNGYRLPSQVQ